MGKISPVRIRIQSYQSIEDLELEISGFTCVTGPTNIGKSAIVRAVSGALLNDPVVGAVRRGAKFCTVDIRSDSWGLRWEKGERDVNRYWLPGQDKPLDKLGQGQTEVTVNLGFGSIRVGKDSVQPWLARQFDPVFLLDESGPAVTDFISEVTRLRVYQDAIVINVRNRRRLLDQVKVHEESLARLNERESALQGLDHLLQVEQDLEAQFHSIQDYAARMRRIRELESRISEHEDAVELLTPSEGLSVPPDRASQEASAAMSMVRWLSSLDSAAKSVLAVKPVSDVRVPEDPASEESGRLASARRFLQIRDLQDAVDLLSGAPDLPVPEDVLSAQAESAVRAARLLERIEAARESVRRAEGRLPGLPEPPEVPDRLPVLARTSSQILSVRAEIADLESRLDVLSSGLRDTEAELARIPVCPTCRQVVPGPGGPEEHLHA